MCQQTANFVPLDSLKVTPVNTAHTCACSSHGNASQPRPEVGRLIPEAHELDFPEVPFPSASVLSIAGEAGLRSVVFRHHELLRASEIGHLFASNDAVFAKVIGHVADYVIEACGGPQKFTELRGSGCMRTRHFPFTIDERGREVWLENLYRAIGETALPVEIREEYWNWMEPFSIRMINRRTTKAQPLRVSWTQAVERFVTAMPA